MDRRVALLRIPSNLALLVGSLAVTLGVAELVLRAVVPSSKSYFTQVPGTDWTLTAAPDVLPGVEGDAHFRINDSGIRGRAFGADSTEFRMLAVGGSTTECTILDETEVWTHLLEVNLERTAEGRRIWVGNVALAGKSTRDHVLHLKYLLPQYPRIDVVLALVGANDLQVALWQGWSYRLPASVTEPAAEAERMAFAFQRRPVAIHVPTGYKSTHVAWYKATALWQVARRVNWTWHRHQTFKLPRLVPTLQAARLERYKTQDLIDSLPSLDAPLVEYRRNLNAMADIAIKAGVELVFITQPSAWRQDMPDAQQRLLYAGAMETTGRSDRSYYTTRALAVAMARYNATLLAVCHQRGLDCVDAAAAMPRDTTALYDDMHFNEHGARLFAGVLAEHFRRRPAFVGPLPRLHSGR